MCVRYREMYLSAWQRVAIPIPPVQMHRRILRARQRSSVQIRGLKVDAWVPRRP